MFKVFITNAVVSKGYENTPALKFSESGESVRFRIGASFYDANAENKTRWINKSVKAFGTLCERLKKLDIKEGTHLNLEGNLILEVWEEDGKEQKAEAVILTDFEFASVSSGEKSGEKNEQKGKESKSQTNGDNNQVKTGGKASVAEQPSNNLGASAFGANTFFSED